MNQRICTSIRKLATLGSLLTFLLVSIIACNKPFPNTLEGEAGGDLDGVVNNERKILLVVVDGARGDALKNATIPNLLSLSDNSIFTINGIADYERFNKTFTIENAWANLLTGVTQTKHQLVTNDFSTYKRVDYPSLFTRLKNERPTLRTAAFTTSAALKENLLADATFSKTLANDQEVKTETIAELKKTDARLVMAQFNGVDLAGQQYGYDKPEYFDAISKIDQYIGELRSEINKRPGSAKENWLIIVASSKGGPVSTPPTENNAFSDALRNSFIFFFNPRFTHKPVPKPPDTRGASFFTGTVPYLTGNATNGSRIEVQNKAGETDQSALDIGDGPFTVEAKIKLYNRSTGNNTYNNMPIITKSVARRNDVVPGGWSFFRINAEVRFWMRSNGASGSTNAKSFEFNIIPAGMRDTMWHTYGAKVTKSGSTYTVTTYFDGVASVAQSAVLAPGESFTSAASTKLRFGFNDQTFVGNAELANVAIADVRVWKAEIPDYIIYQYSCLPGKPPTDHPFINSLVGFWNCRGGSGTQNSIADESGNGRNATVQKFGTGEILWRKYGEFNTAICPPGDPEYVFYRTVPNTVDIPQHIYYWLGVNNNKAWNLDGKMWTTTFDGL